MDKVILKAITEYLGGEFYEFPSGYVLFAEVDGETNREVEERFSRMFDLIIQQGPIYHRIALNDEQRNRLILARKANLPALSRVMPNTCVEDCTVQISKFDEIIKKIEQIPEKIRAQHLKVAIICHMEGNMHPTFLFNENNPQGIKEFEEAIDYLYRKIIIPAGGTLTGEHGIGKIKTPYLELEHGDKVVAVMREIKKLFDPNLILNPGIGKGDQRKLIKSGKQRVLRNNSDKILELQCMRCGFCIASCPSRIFYESEAYSPRGRLSILNGLVHGEIALSPFISDILHACTLCGACKVVCPAGIETFEIFEKARQIIHERRN